MRIETLDLHFQGAPHAIAAFLVFGPEGPVLIETGPGSTLPALQVRLADHGLQPGDIQHVLLTHIHLDHAGAAGWWAAQGATIHVHHRGAPHLIDPSRLLGSAQRIYGDRMDSLWGEILPVPAEQVVVVEDLQKIEAGGLVFTALDTPGHARHHHVYLVEDIAFTGDAAGIQLPDADWLDLPAPPPEFDKEAWHKTLERLRGLGIGTIYRTHFGPSTNVDYELRILDDLIDESAEFIRRLVEKGVDRPTMVRGYLDWIRERAAASGVEEDTARTFELANPRTMSVDGIARYWRKRQGSG